MALDFKKPMTTRNGMEVKFYEIFPHYANGAYLDGEYWRTCGWTIPHGFCTLSLSKHNSRLDLINNEPYKKEA